MARGLAILDEETAALGQGDKLSGETAFKLYDTYGFPLDLTEDALRPRGIGVDKEVFNAAMERQRADARKAWAGSGETATETLWFALKERLGATEFLGYETERSEGVVTAIIHDGGEAFSLKEGARGALILNQTPFYGESGGQVGDVGVMRASGVRFRVENTEEARRPHRSRGRRRRGRDHARPRARARRRPRAPHAVARQPFGHAYSA